MAAGRLSDRLRAVAGTTVQVCRSVDVYGLFRAEAQGAHYHYFDKELIPPHAAADAEASWKAARAMAQSGLVHFEVPLCCRSPSPSPATSLALSPTIKRLNSCLHLDIDACPHHALSWLYMIVITPSRPSTRQGKCDIHRSTGADAAIRTLQMRTCPAYQRPNDYDETTAEP